MQNNKYEIDMTNGPLFGKILRMSVPLMLTGILQLLYNAADIIVVGKYAGETSLAAVGSTTSLIHLIVNLFVGMSLGAGVVVAQYLGAKSEEKIHKAVHTAILLSLFLGIGIGLLGFFGCHPLLLLMNTPEDVLSKAALYVKIYFLGLPGLMVYNFSTSILRAAGDTRRPLYVLFGTGLINVSLNLLFVISLHMDVAGVAVATITAQYCSAAIVLLLLIRSKSSCRVCISKLRIHKSILFQMIRYGLPIGIQSSFFSLSNVLIQSSINTFGSTVMAGNSAASSIEGFVYTACNAAPQTALTFTGQNVGAGKIKRVRKVLLYSCAVTCLFSLSLGGVVCLFRRELMSVYSSEPAVIAAGLIRLMIIVPTYSLCGLMDVFANVIRGMGYSLTPTVTTLFFVCVFRVIWIYTVFAQLHTADSIYYSYPISWLLALFFHAVVYLIIRNKPKIVS